MSGDLQNTSPKPSGKKAKKLNQEEQSERFIEVARELGADESGGNFERAFDKILKPRKDDQPS